MRPERFVGKKKNPVKLIKAPKINKHMWKWIFIQVVPFKPFPHKPWFLRFCSTSVLKTLWEKEKLLVTSNFSFSNIVFYPFGELSVFFIKLEIVVCKLFEFGRV